jgi:putative ABC transport system permease protein
MMAILVTQRRHEIGVRIALGAHPAGAARLVVRDGVVATVIGVALGVVGAVLIAMWLNHNFPDLTKPPFKPFIDPAAYFVMTAIVVATAIAACYIPARRASRVDPMIILREE